MLTPGQPAGVSIGRALAIPDGIAYDELRAYIALLDRVHGVGNLPRIRFAFGQLPPAEVEGLVRRGRLSFSREGNPEGITIDPRLANRELTALHEIGHFIDLSGLGPPRRWESMIEDGMLAEWREVVLRTSAVDRLGELADADDPLVAGLARDALDWPELWARSYTQYVVNRANEASLVSQLDGYRIRPLADVYLPLQWLDGDFAAIDHAIEEIFRGQGWRTA